MIDKEIRARLGIKPGWEAVQLLRDGYMEIHFLPPVEPGGSAGRLRSEGDTVWLETAEGFRRMREQALAEALGDGYHDVLGQRGSTGRKPT